MVPISKEIWLLDIGCGENKAPGAVGVDLRPLPGVDICWDLMSFPWPLANGSVHEAVCHHVVEHILPVAIDPKHGTWFPFLWFMDECWRILCVGGTLTITCPKGGSRGYIQDPTHVNPCNEITWQYFDPDSGDPPGFFFGVYRPRRWTILKLETDAIENMLVILSKKAPARENAIVI